MWRLRGNQLPRLDQVRRFDRELLVHTSIRVHRQAGTAVSFLSVLLNPLTLLIHESQAVLASGVARPRRLSKPPNRFYRIRRTTQPSSVEDPKTCLCFWTMIFGGFQGQLARLCEILKHTFAGCIQIAQRYQRLRTICICCASEPIRGLLGTLLHAPATEITKPEIVLRRGVPGYGGARVPFGRFHEILDSLSACLVEISEVILRQRIAAIGRHPIPSNRFISVLIDSLSKLVSETKLGLRYGTSLIRPLDQSFQIDVG